MKFSIEYLFSNCDQIRSFLRICPYLLKKSLMENLIFDVVLVQNLFCPLNSVLTIGYLFSPVDIY